MDDLSSSSSILISNVHHKCSLDNLPDDIYHFYLFKYLHINDVIKLKRVSKRLYNFVFDNYDISELSFFDYDGVQFDHKTKCNWFSTTKSIQTNYHLNISKLHLLIRSPNNILNLKRLKIDEHQPSFDYEVLNKFIKLQILEINRLAIYSDHRLRLPKLKALSLNILDAKPCYSIEFDAPNLHSLEINWKFQYDPIELKIIKFKNLASIKHLKVHCFSRSLLVFENLECFEFCHSNYIGLDKDLLTFNNLKKLRISSSSMDLRDLDALKDLFIRKRNDLQVVLVGVKLKDAYKVGEYERMDALKFQLNNYGELEDDLNFAVLIDYAYLIHLMPNQPPDLFRKFNNIQSLSVRLMIKDENRLANFIKQCPNLYRLQISGELCPFILNLSQQFYDQLPFISSLFFLEIINVNVNLDCEFIMKMPLSYFAIDQNILTQENLNLNNLKCLRKFKFMMQTSFKVSKYFCVCKEIDDKYRIVNAREMLECKQKRFTYKELVRWSDSLRHRSSDT